MKRKFIEVLLLVTLSCSSLVGCSFGNNSAASSKSSTETSKKSGSGEASSKDSSTDKSNKNSSKEDSSKNKKAEATKEKNTSDKAQKANTIKCYTNTVFTVNNHSYKYILDGDADDYNTWKNSFVEIGQDGSANELINLDGNLSINQYDYMKVVEYNNQFYGVIQINDSNDYVYSYIFKFNADGSITEVLYDELHVKGINIRNDKLAFNVYKKIDVFGSYSGAQTILVDEAGYSAENNRPGFYVFLGNGAGIKKPLVLAQGIQAEVVNDYNATSGEVTNLKAGETLYPVAADIQQHIYYANVKDSSKGSKKTLVAIHYEDKRTEDNFELDINGVPETDVFKELWYAG